MHKSTTVKLSVTLPTPWQNRMTVLKNIYLKKLMARNQTRLQRVWPVHMQNRPKNFDITIKDGSQKWNTIQIFKQYVRSKYSILKFGQ